MIVALKAVYEMLKSACKSRAVREAANAKELINHRKEIAILRKANEELVAEQTEAIAMIEEMAKYLEKH